MCSNVGCIYNFFMFEGNLSINLGEGKWKKFSQIEDN